jgi:hypothetical protein
LKHEHHPCLGPPGIVTVARARAAARRMELQFVASPGSDFSTSHDFAVFLSKSLH